MKYHVLFLVLFFFIQFSKDAKSQSCSGTQLLTSSSGTISDGSGSNTYNNELDCKWLIQPAGASSITLQFTQFETEEWCDYVYVYNGSTTEAPLLGMFHGFEIPANVTSTGGSILIHFTSDGSGSANGWSLNFSSTIGGNLNPVSDFSANITNISNGTSVTFSDLTTNSPTSWQWNFPGGTPSSSTQQNPTVIYNSIGKFDVSLVAFNSAGKDTMLKEDYINVEQNIGPCNGTTYAYGQDGIIHDGSGPNFDYYNNSNCSWLIQPPGAQRISLTFNNFSIDQSDQLKIYDGSSENATLIGTYSGTQAPSEIISTGGSLFIKFITDANWIASGWEAYYSTFLVTNFAANNQIITAGESVQFLDKTTFNPNYWKWIFEGGNPSSSASQNETVSYAIEGNYDVTLISSNGITKDTITKYNYITVLPPPTCSGTTLLSNTNGSFSDGSDAENYSNSLNCKWLIQPPGASTITINFSNIHTERNADFIRIYNGPTTSSQLLAEYSGDTITGSITGTSGSMLVAFTSDASTSNSGWDASYTSTGSGSLIPVADFVADTTEILTNQSVDFTDLSSNNPNSRMWTFYGGTPASSTIQNPTITYNTPGYYDVKLKVSNIYGTDSIIKTSYIKVTDPPGKCQGTVVLTAQTGDFSDGSGNNDYYDFSDCFWLIQPPGANKISLTFLSFAVEQNDFVKIYDGANTSAPLLGTFTGINIPSEILSTSGSLLVHFYTSSDWVAAGWEAHYSTSLETDFYANPLTITAGEYVSFTDNSTMNPSSWQWTFEGGTPQQASTQNPTIQFQNPGSYDVSLTSSNGITTDSKTKFSYINVLSPPSCNGTNTISSEAGTISDGSGASNYSNNLNCYWLLAPINANTINLTFTEFSTEPFTDIVEIFDGDNESSTSLGSFSGNINPGSFTATSGKMLIKFSTDATTTAAGWTANFSIYPVNNESASINNNFYCFPNPFKNTVTIVSTNLKMIEIFDISGRLINKINNPENTVTIETSSYCDGLYFIRASNSETVFMTKLIKQ